MGMGYGNYRVTKGENEEGMWRDGGETRNLDYGVRKGNWRGKEVTNVG